MPLRNKTLARLLRREFGIRDEVTLSQLASALREAADSGQSEVLKGFAEAFPTFMASVDESFAQYERDIDLRTRSLEQSSTELFDANQKLRLEAASQRTALQALRAASRQLLGEAGSTIADQQDDDVNALSELI